MHLKPGDLFYYDEGMSSWMLFVTRVTATRAYTTLFQLTPRVAVYGSDMLGHISLDAVIKAGWKQVG